jgi:hypothetical protein
MNVYYFYSKLIYFVVCFHFVNVFLPFPFHRRIKIFHSEKRQMREGEGGGKDVNSYHNDDKVHNQMWFDRFSHFDLKVNLFWL